MFSRQESSQLRQEFWTAFGQYMKPVPSADGEKINWLNYKTGIKNVLFSMDAVNNAATISIKIIHPDIHLQKLYYEQFLQMKHLLHNSLQEEWTWLLHTNDEYGKTISKIFRSLTEVTVFNKGDWPTLISFFKPRIIALNEFWSFARYEFENLP